jgi:hypothetical protein
MVLIDVGVININIDTLAEVNAQIAITAEANSNTTTKIQVLVDNVLGYGTATTGVDVGGGNSSNSVTLSEGIMLGSQGDDTMYGGTGKNTFIYRRFYVHGGDFEIIDFQIGADADVLDFSNIVGDNLDYDTYRIRIISWFSEEAAIIQITTLSSENSLDLGSKIMIFDLIGLTEVTGVDLYTLINDNIEGFNIIEGDNGYYLCGDEGANTKKNTGGDNYTSCGGELLN